MMKKQKNSKSREYFNRVFNMEDVGFNYSSEDFLKLYGRLCNNRNSSSNGLDSGHNKVKQLCPCVPNTISEYPIGKCSERSNS